MSDHTDEAGNETLDAFGVDGHETETETDTGADAPRVRKRRRVASQTAGTAMAGFLTEVSNRAGFGFVTTRDSHDHRLRYLHKDEGGAYAISNDVLATLQRAEVRTIFVVEVDTGDVYEYAARAYYDGSAVPESYLETELDPQTYATRDSARHVWTDHAPDPFFQPRDTREPL